MKNLIVGQSGGPTAVINSSLYGVIREGFNRSEEIEHVYGMINGIQGFLDGRFMDMKELDNDTLEALRTTPGAYLGSCRFKLPDDLNDAIYPLLFQKFEEMNIGYFFYIGGNDSMDTVSKLSRYAAAHDIDVRIMGIPKTIDNDLILTDHIVALFTITACPNGLFPFTWIMDPMRFAVPTSEKSEEAVIVFFTARSLVSVSVTE